MLSAYCMDLMLQNSTYGFNDFSPLHQASLYPPAQHSGARGMFSAASVCLSVCMFVRMITSERLNIGQSNLAIRYIVQKSRPSSKVKVKGQRSRSPLRKNEKLLSHPHSQCIVGRAPKLGRTQQAVTDDTIAWPPGGDGLRRWENQRQLSSDDVISWVITDERALLCALLRMVSLRFISPARRITSK